MSRYGLPLTCAECGGPIEHVTQGAPIGGQEVRAVCRCTECRTEWVLVVRLLRAHPRPSAIDNYDARPKLPLRQHGTRAGYVRGCRCDQCSLAQAEYDRHRLLAGRRAAS